MPSQAEPITPELIQEVRQMPAQDQRTYWHSRTPEDRLAAMELMRRETFGYDPDTSRIEKVLEFATLDAL